MHGRKRDEYKAIHRNPAMVTKLSKKAIAWHTLQTELLQRQKQVLSTETTASTDNCSASSSTNISEETSVTAAATGTTTSTIDSTTGLSLTNTHLESTGSSDEYISTTLVLLEKAITVNPDPIWLWNFRRVLIHQQLSSIHTKGDNTTSMPAISALFNNEQSISRLGIQNNPKAYAVWHYRKWFIIQYMTILIARQSSSAGSITDVSTYLNNELSLCNSLFSSDERNFHCWSYRRFIISLCLYVENETFASTSAVKMPTGEWVLPDLGNISDESFNTTVAMGSQVTLGRIDMHLGKSTEIKTIEELHLHGGSLDNVATNTLEEEWEFTTSKILDNFSNFSAFHYRSKLLPIIIQIRRQCRSVGDNKDDDRDGIIFQMIHDEFDLIANAIYTEPDDQTAWWYQVFLFHHITTNVLSRNSVVETDSSIEIAALRNKYNEQIIQPHVQQIRELQTETNNCSKWVLIGLLQCLQYMKTNHVATSAASDQTMTTATADLINTINKERRVILQTLIEIDPDRKERYKYKLQHIH